MMRQPLRVHLASRYGVAACGRSLDAAAMTHTVDLGQVTCAACLAAVQPQRPPLGNGSRGPKYAWQRAKGAA